MKENETNTHERRRRQQSSRRKAQGNPYSEHSSCDRGERRAKRQIETKKEAKNSRPQTQKQEQRSKDVKSPYSKHSSCEGRKIEVQQAASNMQGLANRHLFYTQSGTDPMLQRESLARPHRTREPFELRKGAPVKKAGCLKAPARAAMNPGFTFRA